MNTREKIAEELSQIVFRLETNFISFQKRNDPETVAAIIRDFENLKLLKEQLVSSSTTATDALDEVWAMSRNCYDMANEAEFHATHCGDEKTVQFHAAYEILTTATLELGRIARTPPSCKARLVP
jgi:hypothetical protein